MKRQHINANRTVAILGLATVLGLQGCAGKAAGETVEDTNQARDKAHDEVDFPERDDAWVTHGSYVNLENLGKMHAGLTKDQVTHLLGRPHFSEGLFGVREWNYLFQLPDGEGGYRTCQYQVRFDTDLLAESLHWQHAACAGLLEPEPGQRPGSESMTLAADALFAFDSSSLSDEGRSLVEQLGYRIERQFAESQVLIKGYTDHLGREAYNHKLSKQRAEAVRSVLIQEGIHPTKIESRGYGENNPVVQCQGHRPTQALKQCLKPNRRVEVEVEGSLRR